MPARGPPTAVARARTVSQSSGPDISRPAPPTPASAATHSTAGSHLPDAAAVPRFRQAVCASISLGPSGRGVQQVCSDPQRQRNILRRHLRGRLLRVRLRIQPLHQVMRPRVEVIDPRLDRESPRPDPVHRKPRAPQIVRQRLKAAPRSIPAPLSCRYSSRPAT